MAFGGLPEWLKEPVLKTGEAQASVGSNPTSAAIFYYPGEVSPGFSMP